MRSQGVHSLQMRNRQGPTRRTRPREPLRWTPASRRLARRADGSRPAPASPISASAVSQPSSARRVRRAAAAAPDDTDVVDAGLCHGALCLAHLWNRLWQATGATDLREAARRWYEIGLGMRSPEQGVGGFAAWDVRVGLEPEWIADPGFLTGAAGVGLALLAVTSDLAPEWDRVLLLDLAREPVKLDCGSALGRLEWSRVPLRPAPGK